MLWCLSCGDTGRSAVRYPLYARGAEQTTRKFGDFQVELEVAELTFGPLYLCATAGASTDLCPSAVAEFAASAPVNLLDPEQQALGEVHGLYEQVRSATYDYGITWFNTQRKPTTTAEAIDGHSLHMEGRAFRDDERFDFVVDVDLTPKDQGTRVVQGARVDGQRQATATALTLTFDPLNFWAGVDFEQLATEAQSADSPLTISADSRAMSALVLAITASSPPTFTWSH